MTPVLNRPLDVRVSVVGLDSISFVGLFKKQQLQVIDFVSCANCQPKNLFYGLFETMIVQSMIAYCEHSVVHILVTEHI